MTEKKELMHPIFGAIPTLQMEKVKIVSADEAVSIIRDSDTVATEGFVCTGFAEEISIVLEQHFLKTGRATNLTIVYAAGQSDSKERGLSQLAHEGLVGLVAGGHIVLALELQKLIRESTILARNFPQDMVGNHRCGVARA